LPNVIHHHLVASFGIDDWNVIASERKMYSVPMCSVFDRYGSRLDTTHQLLGRQL